MRRGSRRALPSLLPRPVAQQCTCLASHLCGMCVLPRQEQVCLAATLTLSLSQECTELAEIINENDQEPKFVVFLCCHVRASPSPACLPCTHHPSPPSWPMYTVTMPHAHRHPPHVYVFMHSLYAPPYPVTLTSSSPPHPCRRLSRPSS